MDYKFANWRDFWGLFLWLAIINFKFVFHASRNLLKKLTNHGNLSKKDGDEINELIKKT